MDTKKYQCPYDAACMCSMDEPCPGCESFTPEKYAKVGRSGLGTCYSDAGKLRTHKEDYSRLFEIQDEIRDALSTTIKIDHKQVLYIVVADLLEKYKGAIKRKDIEYQEPFGKVLRFYVDEDELNMLMKV